MITSHLESFAILLLADEKHVVEIQNISIDLCLPHDQTHISDCFACNRTGYLESKVDGQVIDRIACDHCTEELYPIVTIDYTILMDDEVPIDQRRSFILSSIDREWTPADLEATTII